MAFPNVSAACSTSCFASPGFCEPCWTVTRVMPALRAWATVAVLTCAARPPLHRVRREIVAVEALAGYPGIRGGLGCSWGE
jgi:hypothetical protein